MDLHGKKHVQFCQKLNQHNFGRHKPLEPRLFRQKIV